MIQARCAVCGTALERRIRACGRCESLYHPDCWQYNDGCAIYGCRQVVARKAARAKRVAPPSAASPGWYGPAFGAMLGTAVMGTFHLLVARRLDWEPLFFVACATLLGAVTGALVRGQDDTARIMLCGLFGPGVAANVIGSVVSLNPGLMLLAPIIAVFGLIAAPLAFPCAMVAAQFNDPQLARPGRRERWLTTVAVAMVAVFVAIVTRAIVGR